MHRVRQILGRLSLLKAFEGEKDAVASLKSA